MGSAAAVKSTESLARAQEYLTVWGQWMRAAAGAGISPVGVAAYTRERVDQEHFNTPEDSKAELVDRILARMKLKHRDLWVVVCHRYWHQESDPVAASLLNVSEKTYRQRRLMAECYVESGIELRGSLTDRG